MSISEYLPIYTVYVVGGDPSNIEHVRVVARTANVNFLDARRLLRQSRFPILEGDPFKVHDIRQKLDAAGLQLEIVPDFRY